MIEDELRRYGDLRIGDCYRARFGNSWSARIWVVAPKDAQGDFIISGGRLSGNQERSPGDTDKVLYLGRLTFELLEDE